MSVPVPERRFEFKVDEIPLSGLDLHLSLEPDWLASVLPLAYKPEGSPAVFEGRLDRSGENLLFNGLLRFKAAYQCSRCAEDFVLEASARMGGLFAPEDQSRTRLESLEVDDLEDEALEDMFFYDNGVVDLEDQVANAVITSLEPFPICREDCKGLCLRCGSDLNAGPCNCAPKGDDRFAALATLLKQKTGTAGADKE